MDNNLRNNLLFYFIFFLIQSNFLTNILHYIFLIIKNLFCILMYDFHITISHNHKYCTF
jgi:hypothetical protein